MSSDKFSIIKFPDPSKASEDGIVAVGGELNTHTLLLAYSNGIFPWPHEGYPMLWFCPWERGILRFDNLHIPQSLKKFIKKQNWSITMNKAFSLVISHCATVPRPNQNGTWINNELISAYTEFHQQGYAHSLEVWENDQLIGGIYGVFVKNVFSAESMFYIKSNASKYALWMLIEKLQSIGLKWMDVQMLTAITENFGGEYISQNTFLKLLRKSQNSPLIYIR